MRCGLWEGLKVGCSRFILLFFIVVMWCGRAHAQYDIRTILAINNRIEFKALDAAPTAPLAGWGAMYYDGVLNQIRCNLNAAGTSPAWGPCFSVSGGAGGVSFFNGRSGSVTFQSGDATAAQITVTPPAGLSAVNVQQAVDQLAVRTGAVTKVFNRTGDVTQQTGDYNVSQVTGAAPINSPALLGVPTAPTPLSTDSSNRIATTAMVQSALTSGSTAPCATCVTTNTAQTIVAPKTITTTAATSFNVIRPAGGAGTIAATSGLTAVTGTGTSFTTFLAVGDAITLSNGQTRTIATITSNTAATVTAAWSATCASCTFITDPTPRLAVTNNSFRVQTGTDDLVIAQFGRTVLSAFQSLVELRTAKTIDNSGNETGRGAIRFYDHINALGDGVRSAEMGYYQWGFGIFTNQLFEFWTNGVSVRAAAAVPPFFEVRDLADTKGIRLTHNGTTGNINTTGVAPGGITMGGNGQNVFSTSFGTVQTQNNDGTTNFFGHVFGIAPAAADNSARFPTTAWVQTETLNATEGDALFLTPAEGSTAYVDATGNETVAGNKTFTNGLFEEARTVRAGGWATPTYSGASYTAQGGTTPTWTVDSGDVTTLRYTLVGKKMTVAFIFRTTSVTGSPTVLRFTIPNSMSSGSFEFSGTMWYSENGSTFTPGHISIDPLANQIRFYKQGFATAWTTTTNTTRIEGQIEIEVQ